MVPESQYPIRPVVPHPGDIGDFINEVQYTFVLTSVPISHSDRDSAMDFFEFRQELRYVFIMGQYSRLTESA